MDAGEIQTAFGFTSTPTDDGSVPQRRGDRPMLPLSKRVDMALDTYKHAIFRAVVRGDFSESWCTCIPAYTGGEDVAQRPVAVDGRLRTPACFGGRGEPWAQVGRDDVGDDAQRVTDRVLDVTCIPYGLRPATA